MAARPSLQPELCFADAPPAAQDVARGVTRLFFNQDIFAICEVPLRNGRRADMMAIDSAGTITIVEIKVSRADLMGDCKWNDYLAHCDRFERLGRQQRSTRKQHGGAHQARQG